MSDVASQASQFKRLVDSLGLGESMIRMTVGLIARRFQRTEAIVVREFLRLVEVLKGVPGAESDPLTAFRKYAATLDETIKAYQASAERMVPAAKDNPDVEFVRDDTLAKVEALTECRSGILAILDRYPTPLPPAVQGQ